MKNFHMSLCWHEVNFGGFKKDYFAKLRWKNTCTESHDTARCVWAEGGGCVHARLDGGLLQQ